MIARLMAMTVIDSLELVDIEAEEGKGEVVPTCPVHLVLEIAEEEAPVVDTGELVLEDQGGRVLPYVFQEIG